MERRFREHNMCKAELPRVCLLQCITSAIDSSGAVGKFSAQFNNVMSVLDNTNNEMPAVQSMKSYCLSSLLYACEIWSLSTCDAHLVNSAKVAYNN